MEILDEENYQVNLDNINMLSNQLEFNSKYDELLEDYNDNIDLTVFIIAK